MYRQENTVKVYNLVVSKIIKSSTAIVAVFYKFIVLTLDLIFLSKPFSVKCSDIISNAVKRRVKYMYSYYEEE